MHNGRLIGDPTKVANIFNEHFATIGSKIGNKIPPESDSFPDYLIKRNRNGKPFIYPTSASFFLSPTTPGEIELIINCVNTTDFYFRSGYATLHALIILTEHIRKFLDSKHYVCEAFVDLGKAFDTVDHRILCNKLEYYGLRAKIKQLIQSYLNNRLLIIY